MACQVFDQFGQPLAGQVIAATVSGDPRFSVVGEVDAVRITAAPNTTNVVATGSVDVA